MGFIIWGELKETYKDNYKDLAQKKKKADPWDMRRGQRFFSGMKISGAQKAPRQSHLLA